MLPTLHARNQPGLPLTSDTFNAALNGSSIEDANRMEDRNPSLFIVIRLFDGVRQLGVKEGGKKVPCADA